uniref:HEAT repeat-containing protein 1 n=1 Tax=Anisakis simplex TaxID=6269 RepID=A0A0M3KGX2_ANISI
LACVLLSRFSVEPEGKRKRAENNDVSLRKNEIFRDEDENAYLNRVKFVLELLSANQQLEASSQIFVILFDIFKMSMNSNDSDEVHSTHSYIQQLVVSLLVRLLKEPHGYKITKQDLQLDCVVETIRRTRDHNTLRSCLSLLTAAVHISSFGNIAYDVSVHVYGQTLNALFGAIMDEKGEALLTRLVSVSRILSASMLDMPAHRRLSVVTSIATAIHSQHLPIICAVLFEHYCITWQRNDSNKG